MNPKISIAFFVIFLNLFICSKAFSKDGKVAEKIIPENEINIKLKDNREEIKSFDFNKIFSDAEKYYKQAKSWKKLKCEPKSGFVCTKHECKKREVKAYVILDKNKKIISRCESGECENFPAEFEQAGVYFNIQTKGPIGTLIRVLGDSRYKEITTVALDAYIANGNCDIIIE